MRKSLLSIGVLLLAGGITKAQSVYQPYSYDFYQKFNTDAYSTKTRLHTAMKPYLVDDSLLRARYDSLMDVNKEYATKHPALRPFFYGHTAEVQRNGYTFYGDILPDFVIGRDFSNDRTTHLSSLGIQLGGTVGSKLSYNISGFLNNSIFPDYIQTYVNQVGVIPGMAQARVLVDNPNSYNWRYITGTVSYTPNKYFNFSAGRDKTFIGDGYRSVLLSDYATPYPFFKVTANVGNVKYMSMWGYFNDPALTSDHFIDRKKWGVFHYLDWNVNNRLSFGFFDSVIWADTDDAGNKHGFDFNYVNPFIFLRPVEASNGSPDNAVIGITTKYKISDMVTAYGQFSLDEFQAKEFFNIPGSSRNKFGYQVGLKGTNLFKVNNLNFMVETNTVRPYTFSERASIINYSANSEPLAHPWGANLREVVGILNYSYKRFDFMAEADYGRYGLDNNGANNGKDIFLPYTEPVNRDNNNIGQGLTTNMVYLQGKVAYVLNPRTNLRIELGGIYRNEKNAQFNDKTSMITLGLRSSFRQIYNDLASYRPH
ncbi:gliding motility protein RemB [Mucilaginibacter pallidiroseus]|uniref:Gliding motility protein RemB n=1 Tax=Mucilaginibacter pallidiroseus TaxID=2599295 RepID=A0A563UGF0_9SPHI|nr:gliding motility protein RemB [Mucilaginibacter pallidiroseus]TWR30421.1 gliding motility protein RemB [Mucilaginibacter pallidiroseus]